MSMRKNYFIILILLGIGGRLMAQAFDGPYVCYRGNKVFVYTILNGDGGLKAVIDSFPAIEKPKHPLQVNIPGHPDWDFNVTLQQSIKIQPVEYSGSDKILSVSDIEGEFAGFRKLLLDAGVIDKQYRWTFGKGNLLVAGDLFDRGHEVTQYLWLLYKLEQEAIAKGGYVHIILGNHEIMNLVGDFRYVEPMYKESAHVAGLSYKDFYAGNTELGRWLRSKNTVEKIGGVLILHGGISPEVLRKQISLEAINVLCRKYYGLAHSAIPDSAALFFGEDALFWYRGYFLDPKATEAEVESTLKFYQCSKILVGHDIVEHVTSLYRGKVIGLDVDTHKGNSEALLIIKGKYYRVDNTGVKTIL